MVRLLIGLQVLAAFSLAGSYDDSIHAWQKHRIEGLRAPDSWLTLVGLFWLHEGMNTVGTSEKNDFVLPKGSGPERAGQLQLRGSTVTYIQQNGTREELKYAEVEDSPEKPQLAHAGRITFFVIKRGDRLAIRAKDSDSPVRTGFTGMEFFPINPELHFHAKFVPDANEIPILDVTGRTKKQPSPGHVEFAYRGKTYRLRPVFEGKTLFFLYKDLTNRTNTYQAGRMLNTPQAVDGVVDLDFNRSYNPPCTFTPYATCPLPPKENRLQFAVEAGEKRYGKGHAEIGTR